MNMMEMVNNMTTMANKYSTSGGRGGHVLQKSSKHIEVGNKKADSTNS